MDPIKLKRGMLIFQKLPAGGLVDVITRATDSDISHVGILDRQNGKWVVIEAFGTGVQITPYNQFISRSNLYAFKKIRGLTGKKRDKFIATARQYIGQPYDYKFQYKNAALYCSELVGVSALAVGINLYSVEMPAYWLNFWNKSVRQYLAEIHGIRTVQNIPKQWKILPPHALYYSNDLVMLGQKQDVFLGKTTPSNAIYDTLPGKTIEEKYRYLKKNWKTFIQDAKILTEDLRGHRNYHFRIRLGERQFSLTLFGKFQEERTLAKMILKYISLHRTN